LKFAITTTYYEVAGSITGFEQKSAGGKRQNGYQNFSDEQELFEKVQYAWKLPVRKWARNLLISCLQDVEK
jgi:hypothetical protein